MSDENVRPLAVVTGASSGIGRELANQFVAHGYDLLVAAEDPGIQTAATELMSGGAHVGAVQVTLPRSTASSGSTNASTPQGVLSMHS